MEKENKMRVAFHTLGCKVNQYETEAMRQQFAARGFEPVGEEDMAEVYVINTCTFGCCSLLDKFFHCLI